MLEEIHFSPEDALYVLGDVVDRGPRPVEILRDMSMRGNNNICIDCGACFPNGCLACLCLDTMREYYV